MLTLDKHYINSELYFELEFDNFIKLFNFNLPILNNYILKPLDSSSANLYFSKLKKLSSTFNKDINLNPIFDILKEIQPIHFDILALQEKKTTLDNLFNIGTFLKTITYLVELSKENLYLKQEFVTIKEILLLLNKYLEDDFSNLKPSPELASIMETKKIADDDLINAIKKTEKDIKQIYNLQILYPLQKKIDLGSEHITALSKDKDINLSKTKEGIYVSISFDGSLEPFLANDNNIEQTLHKESQSLLEIVTTQLNPFTEKIKNLYFTTQNSAYLLSLLKGKLNNNLTIPSLSSETQLSIKNGNLPSLSTQTKDYIPLNIELKKGVNVIFGANVTGKSTVLKTCYFISTIACFGLPVPAEDLTLNFSNNILIHTKNSGSIQTKRSSYSDELFFLQEIFQNKSLIFIDEFFNSTNPLGSEQLMNFFIDVLSKQNLILLFTTHFTKILERTDLKIFKMLDEIELDNKSNNKTSLNDLLSQTPFKPKHLKTVNIDEIITEQKKSLLLPLKFNFPQEIKDLINNYLKEK